MDYSQIITIEPGKRSGKPCIRGLRITVGDVLGYRSAQEVVRAFLAKDEETCLILGKAGIDPVHVR